jgi:hypothetical protein
MDYAGRLTQELYKQLIGRRLKQVATRWKLRRVEQMAALFAVQTSDQWVVYWDKAT